MDNKKFIPYSKRPFNDRYGATSMNFAYKDQESQVLDELENFALVAPKAWGPNTVHPDYTFQPGRPYGQCGSTIVGLAIWMVWREIVAPEQITYNRGRIVDDKGNVVGSHHANLVLDIDNPYNGPEILKMGIDLTGNQFARISGIAADADGYPSGQHAIQLRQATGTKSAAWWFDYPETAPQSAFDEDLTYEVEKSEPFVHYDVGNFDWRLADFLGHFYRKHTVLNIGHRALRGTRENLWWPKDSAHTRDEVFDRLESTKPKITLPRAMIRPASRR